MKIKKVDDKPMVIHTKKKAKIHMHEPKKAKIKGSNIYTVQRGPKIASAKINDTGKKKSYRKSTIHQAEKKWSYVKIYVMRVAKLITAMTKEGKFKDAIQDKIGATVDTTDLEKQLSVLKASIHQAETIKPRLEQQMDNLDVTDTHYNKKISDLQRRLDAQYDRIDEVEETMTELKIKASQFVQKKGEEHVSSDLVAKPVMKLPTAEHFGLTEDKEKRLSEIIDEINSRTGKNYDNDVVVKAMLQMKDILMKSDKLKTSAKNNTQQDFEFSYFDDIDDALIEGLSQNQDFFSMLLSNDEMKRQVLGIFSGEIYKSLRESL